VGGKRVHVSDCREVRFYINVLLKTPSLTVTKTLITPQFR